MRILFIAGYVRSGSTLLSLMLGNLDGCFSLGEMSALVYGPDTSLEDQCMCGRALCDCPYWSEVWSAAFPQQGMAARAELQNLLAREARLRSRRPAGGPARRGLGGEIAGDARAGMRRLYEAAARVAGDRILIDSSKTPAHAFMLQSCGVRELAPLHLVRHPCAVAYSQSRVRSRPERLSEAAYLPRRGVLRSIAGWTRANLLAERLLTSCSTGLRLRYEDLVQHPRRTLGSVRHLIETTWPGVADPSDELTIRHDVAGNPGKAKWDSTIDNLVPDTDWLAEMPRSRQALVQLLGWPLMLRYGYRWSLS